MMLFYTWILMSLIAQAVDKCLSEKSSVACLAGLLNSKFKKKNMLFLWNHLFLKCIVHDCLKQIISGSGSRTDRLR